MWIGPPRRNLASIARVETHRTLVGPLRSECYRRPIMRQSPPSRNGVRNLGRHPSGQPNFEEIGRGFENQLLRARLVVYTRSSLALIIALSRDETMFSSPMWRWNSARARSLPGCARIPQTMR